MITDPGIVASVHLVLNQEEEHQAHHVQGWFNTGPVDILLVAEMSKPDNCSVLLKLARMILEIEPKQYQEYNLDQLLLA